MERVHIGTRLYTIYIYDAIITYNVQTELNKMITHIIIYTYVQHHSTRALSIVV